MPLLVAALVTAGAAFGQDAGTDPCIPACEGNTLFFCDSVTGEELSIDCAELDEGARCGELSETWGFDCLLPQGAPCAPGYAQGMSRCDPPLFCNHDGEMGTCSTEPGEYAPPPLPDTAGGLGDVPVSDPHPLSCIGCTDANDPTGFFGIALAWHGLRQLRRRRLR